ncbi:tetratricopeptide repeat protein [Chloroflexota bacterium]
MNMTEITQWIFRDKFGDTANRKIIISTIGYLLAFPLILVAAPIFDFFPLIAVALSWVWFTLPGLVLSYVIVRQISWLERIPISFVLSIGLYTPVTMIAILFQMTLTSFIWLTFVTYLLITAIYFIYFWRFQPSQGEQTALSQVVARDKIETGSYVLIVFVLICAGMLAFVSANWPPAGDDISGLPIFSEVLRTELITAAEPFHGSGTPSTPRNELIIWTYQNILVNRVSGVSPVDYFMSTRPLLIILSFFALYTLLHQFFKKNRLALFMLSFWSIYILATTRIEGIGSNLITRIIQDKFLGWFVVVPILLVFFLWYLEGREWRFLAGFSVAAFGATLVHPITMTQFMILGGAFSILYLILNRSKKTVVSLSWLTLVIAFCLGILLIQYFRYQGYFPIREAGLGDAVEFGRIRMAVSRYRLWLLDGGQYILHPSIVLQPIILLGYLLLPAQFKDIRENNGARLILSSMVILPILLFVPPLANLVGRLVTPYLLWRLAWPIETFAVLSIGWVVWQAVDQFDGLIEKLSQQSAKFFSAAIGLIVIFIALLIARPNIVAGSVNLRERLSEAKNGPCVASAEATAYIDRIANDSPVNVLASQSLNFCIPGFAPLANVIEYRGLGTVNRLPIDEIPASLQRVEDSHYFSDTDHVDDLFVEIIKRYDIDYVMVENDRLALNMQLKFLPDLFNQVFSDDEITIYTVNNPLPETGIVSAYTELRNRQWGEAEQIFNQVLQSEPNQPLAYYGLGEALEGQGKIEQALANYTEAKDLAEDEPALHAKVAETYLLMNEVEQSAREYQQAISLAPSRSSLYVSLGRAYLLADQKDRAKDSFERSVEFKVSKGSAIYHTILAKLMAEVGWFSQAIENYQKALELEPDPLRYVALGKILAQNGDLPGAFESFHTAQEMDSWLFVSHLQLGGIYMLQGELDKAIQEYETAWRLNPTYNSPFILLGQAIQAKSGTEQAIARLQSIAPLNEVLPGPHRGLATLYAAIDQKDAALAELDFCSVIQPKDASIQAAIGYLLLADGQYNKAEQAYESALFDNPDLISVRLGLSSLYAQDDESGSEIGQLYQIIRNEPTLAWPHLSLAGAYRNLGMWDVAREEIEWALKLEPDNAEGHLLLGNLYQTRANWEKAISSYQQALEIEPDNTDALVQLAQVYQTRGDHKSAQKLLEKSVRVNPQDAYALMKLSEVYWSQGLFDESTAMKESAVEADPDSGYALMLLANSYYQQGKVEEANYLYQRAIQIEPSLIAAYSAEAQLETERDNNFIAASTLFSTAINANPSSSIVHLVAGRYFQQRGQFEEAEQAFRTGLSLPSNSADNYLALSDLQLLRGDREEALQSLQLALEAFPGEAAVYDSLADFYLERGKIEKALDNYERAIALNPAYLPAYNGIAQLYQSVGNLILAEMILEQARANNPGAGEGYIALANFYESIGDLSQAESYLNQAIDIAPAELNVYLNMGQFYQRQNRFEDALQIYQEAEYIPANTPDLYLNMGELFSAMSQPDEAIRYYQAALPLDRSDPRPYLALAEVYQSIGKRDQAIDLLNEALVIQPNNVSTHIALGKIYHRLAQFPDAQYHYEIASSYDLNNFVPLIALSEIYQINGDWTQAEKLLGLALDISPTNLDVYNALAQLYNRQGFFSQAETTYSTGIQNSLDKSRAYSNRAAYYSARGEWENAQADYETAWHFEPTSQVLGMQLVNFLVRRGSTEEAMAVLTQLEDIPNAAAQGQIAKGNIYSSIANWSAATTAFQEAIQLGDNQTEAYASFARIHELQGNVDESLKLYQSASGASPYDPQAFINLGDAYQIQLDYSSAREAYEQAIKMNPGNISALTRLDILNRAQGEPGIDPAYLLSLADSRPSAELYRTLGYLYQSQGEWQTANYWYQKAITIEPYNSDNWLDLANYHRALDQWEQALDALEEGLKYQPASSGILVAMGSVQEKLELKEDAFQSYRQAIEVDPTRFDGYGALANLQLESGQIEDALQTIQNWIEIAPGNYRGYAALADLYLENGETDLAVTTYQSGLDLMPGAAELYVGIGNIYGKNILEVTDDLASAEAYERTVRNRITEVQSNILPDPTRAQRRVAELKLIDALDLYRNAQNQLKAAQLIYEEIDSDFESAKAAFSRAVELQPSNEAALLGLGRINLALGSTDEALQYYQASVNANPNSVVALSYLGNAYLEADNPGEAIDVFEDLLIRDPTNTFAHIGLYRTYAALDQTNLVQTSATVEHSQFTWDYLMNYLRATEQN